MPILINNPEQVNIAADGGQQVNVQKKHNKKQAKKQVVTTSRSKQKTAIKSAPKQLGAKSRDEVIEMKSAKGDQQRADLGSRRLRMAKSG